ncbi:MULTISPECIES: TspO/MBR family protein [Halomonadaceae]|jgi:tryptophan-rich sensory protein|uniref:TspO/MBR family protein n=1 Tax=Halomonadaceae TaxID=28256 RepID=UPI00111AE053|nr:MULTISPECIES: TspO/MBR family protein [Halomonas]MCG7578426.1 tryptophan-rich sensory protein [Halomonas sp. MMH1-48]MCG7590396.1 tryptophan-rich sensory protein [Halomonas sp. McD50-5]MCG7605541.1 tryptophan-rich sensory protein [Halomonas sp. MM17-34]MCG7614721.1 tryptophan-rich sensory protein [Halomonas sp. MM17-29]MCG7616508.1 tryptophan-rich sensory protein [Halomonas sp. McD50-4]
MFGSLMALLVSLLLVGAAAMTGARFRPDGWYRTLRKPRWTPPDLAFPIAWGILYLLMAIAAWRIYMADDSPLRSASLAVYGAQLLANAAWSWLFFGRKQIGAALVDIVVLLGLITLAIGLFAQVNTFAAWLMVPYWLWVALALALNATILRLNRA